MTGFSIFLMVVGAVAFLVAGVYCLFQSKKSPAEENCGRYGSHNNHASRLNLSKWICIGGVAVFFLSTFLFYLSGLELVGATEEGVVVSSPIWFGEEGVQKEALYTGRHFIWHTSKLEKYDAKPFTKTEQFDDLPSRDNVQMDFKIHTVFELKKGSAPKTHDTVGPTWYENRIKAPYCTEIRSRMTDLSGDEMRLDEKKLRETENAIKMSLERILANAGIEYKVSSVSVGGVTPPADVLAEAARTAAQVQRKKTENERDAAEQARKNAEASRAIADKEYVNKMGLSPAQFVTLEGYEAYKTVAEACAKSKEKCTMIVGAPGMPTTLPLK